MIWRRDNQTNAQKNNINLRRGSKTKHNYTIMYPATTIHIATVFISEIEWRFAQHW